MTTLLDAVIAEAKREETLSPRERELSLYTLGELARERERELWAQADADPELRTALEAHRPLSAERREAIAVAAVAAFAERSTGRGRASRTVTAKRAPGALVAFAPRGSRHRRVLGSLVPLVAAAALAVFLWPGRELPLGSLPEYRLEVRGGLNQYRGSSASGSGVSSSGEVARLRLRAGAASRPELLLRPQSSVSISPECALYVGVGSEPLRPWPHRAELAPSGAVLLRLDEPERLPVGARLIVVLRASEGQVPSADEVAAREATSGPGWSRWVVEVERGSDDGPGAGGPG